MIQTSFLIVGAGPFGLSMATEAQRLGIDYRIVGQPMELWRKYMPNGMCLRGVYDLDPTNAHTIEGYLEHRGLKPGDVDSFPLSLYLDYVEWFQRQKRIEPIPAYVQELNIDADGQNHFIAELHNGETILADTVLLALGFQYFSHVPDELADILPPGRYGHTRGIVDFSGLAGLRCLIVGGRQSAFEWAALLREAGAAKVHVVYRHATPTFAKADMSWVDPLLERMVDDPGWFRRLSKTEKDEINHRWRLEGDMKIEPWLADRVLQSNVILCPDTEIDACTEQSDGALTMDLSNGDTVTVDRVILATGYKVEMDRISFLHTSSLGERIATRNGFPVLDEYFQSSVPGLFITGMPATRDFGPFFSVTAPTRASARIIGKVLCAR
uniref:Pyridine nucleotide-disulphide oxidoreductase n=1 Tax=Candidatus Kentrum sp. TUN TaxID=2126343 RepID=A0A450ZPG6_9GAMM|nr:MAG: Pyridine nucleotide-disulphide oxidoreductase [Candidatus Kentron sp. TUN]VFK62928.1 MAG: Pyridine nucleotide-disulphide oxidoreductase [Candidatus Kentron sp. TUN]VFK67835.1 MAG: Pyridine nucleotide-disulphide oxidoreductase [Candidatus Kentron sp. TUN]